MRSRHKRIVVLAVAGSMLVGGAIGATVFSAGASNAANGTTTQQDQSRPTGPGPYGGFGSRLPTGGKFTPNENKAHEAGESKQREAQEDVGKIPTVA
jgi:hypothetical protein